MEEQDNIGTLFREKLEFAEVIPSGSLRNDLMRKTARKEFLRFNPYRINIYYITLLLAAAATALILITDSSRRDNSPPQAPGNVTSQVPVIPDLPASAPSKPIPVRRQADVSAPENKNNFKSPAGINDSAVAETDLSNAYKPGGISLPPLRDVSSIKGLFDEKPGGGNELKGLISVRDGLIESTAKEGCAPLKIKFNCGPGSYDSYRWSFGNTGSSELKDPEWTFRSEGEYRVILVARRSDGMRLTSYIDIKVNPRPLARFEIRQAEDGSGNETKFINYSLNASRFHWSFGDGSISDVFEPSRTYSRPGNYRIMLVALSDQGCADTMTFENTFTGNNYFVNFPNAFIPNPGGPTGGFYSTKSDESAQVFHPVFSGVAEYRLRIFSKIGVLIFETGDINIGWDGYFKGQLSEPGVYVWKVMGSYLNGEKFIKSGDVTILKAER